VLIITLSADVCLGEEEEEGDDYPRRYLILEVEGSWD